MMVRIVLFSFFIISALNATGQTGGTYAFPLLDLTFNARSAGLGNEFISVKDQDINLGITNPSLLNAKMHNTISVNQALLAGGINYGMLAYGRSMFGGVVSTSMRYVNYGEFRYTDVTGADYGSFHPFECVVGVGYGRQLNPRISVGANFNLLYSQLEIYNAFGASIDLAGTYTSKSENLLVTAMMKNVGYQFNGYSSKQHDPLPMEMQMAASYKLGHAPFRFSLLAHHLNRWDLSYKDPNALPTLDPLTGDTIPVPTANFGEKLARHFTYQAEILISKSIHLRAGFDFNRRQEMKLVNRPGVSGFTFGIGLYFKKFTLDYGFSSFSSSGSLHMLTLSSCIDRWRK